ncbi:AbrB/MazE/SpoVT family DNA-binding domain-containing protein [Candidatus Woesearchaeota archaeon]|nr:AbrB/MazE/SpoVT family DNA-binding domain-containing protein [Candidatus Woesearchaeota archaeon]
MLETVKLSSKGQIVIPERIRKKLGLKEGDNLILREEGGRFSLEQEESFMRHLEQFEKQRERMGWLMLAEENLKKLWDNPIDEKEWGRYL